MAHSKRAPILSRVLEYINSDDWKDEGDYLIFGREAFEREQAGTDPDDPVFDDSLRRLVTKRKTNRGEIAVAKRTSLGDLPKDAAMDDLLGWLSKQTPDLRSEIMKGLKNYSTQASTETLDADHIDAALTAAALRDLEKTVGRIAAFDEINSLPGFHRGAPYFAELHRCDCLGLAIAACVLCRAMLESALIEVIDPEEPPAFTSPGNRIKEARRRGILDKEREDAAFRVKEAGDWAIHKLDQFKNKHKAHVQQRVDETRKVLIDLYNPVNPPTRVK